MEISTGAVSRQALSVALLIVFLMVDIGHPGRGQPATNDPYGTMPRIEGPDEMSLSPASTYALDAIVNLTPGQQYVSVNGVGVGDVDNDGKNETIANFAWYINGGTPKTVILSKSGSSYTVKNEISNFSMVINPGLMVQGLFHVVVGDAFNDGKNELLMRGKYNGVDGVYLFRYNGTGYVKEWSTSALDGEIADVDADGKNELAVPGPGILRWNGSSFAKVANLPSSAGVRIGDMDGDKKNETVLAEGNLGIGVYKWSGSDMVRQGGASGTGYIMSGFGVGDTDHDGLAEAFAVEYHNNMAVFGWNGSAYVKEWGGATPGGDNPVTGWVGDADSDGVGEIFVGNGNYAYGISVTQYEFDGSGYTKTWDSGSFDMYCHSIVQGDADNDGVNELVAGTGAMGRVYIYSPVIPKPSAPSEPRNLKAAAGDKRIDLSWTPPFSNGGSPVTNYSIYRGNASGGETFLTKIGNVTSYSDLGLTNAKWYYYKVKAKNAIGEGPLSSEASAIPGQPPTVVNTNPKNGDVNVSITTNIIIAFSEPMNTSSAEGAISSVPSISGKFYWDASAKIVTWYPSTDLLATTWYIITISTLAKGMSGANMLSPYTFYFVTASPPSTDSPNVLSTSPTNGEVNVPIYMPIEVRWSKQMDTVATEQALSFSPSVSCSWSWSYMTQSCTPSSTLQTGTYYQVTISTDAKDKTGNHMKSNYIFSFRTFSSQDTNPPYILETSPMDAETNVLTTSTIRISWNEDMDTIAAQNAFSSSPSMSCSWSWSYHTQVCSPYSPLQAGRSYYVSISTNAKDLAGNAMSSSFYFRFTTSSSGDSTPPYVVSTDPSNGEKDVDPSSKIVISFSERMDMMATEGAIYVSPGVAPTKEWNVGGTTLTLTAKLVPETKYAVYISTSATDVAGNHLLRSSVFSFTTGRERSTSSALPIDASMLFLILVFLVPLLLALFIILMKRRCPKCRASVARRAEVCHKCGYALVAKRAVPIMVTQKTEAPPQKIDEPPPRPEPPGPKMAEGSTPEPQAARASDEDRYMKRRAAIERLRERRQSRNKGNP
jgi:hypothetical protein